MRTPTVQRIGRYELLDELGRGAMGIVYRARDTQIGRIVALKIILTKNASAAESEHYRQRFQREAQAAGRLSHPGIVTLHDIAEDEQGQPYIVMEFIEGRPLNALLAPPAQVPLDRLLEIAIQVAHALDFAHRSGVIHRDIKPENIMVMHDGRAKITDFGIAKLAGADLTQEGTSLGTPSYMSPEQFHGKPVDARSDLFSLGAVIYWMCTGQKPFPGESVTTITFQVLFQPTARAHELKPGLPPDLDRILARCLAKDPADRYASCADLAADLVALRVGRPLALALAGPGVPAERTAPMPALPGPAAPAEESTQPLAATPASSSANRTISAASAPTPTVLSQPPRAPQSRGRRLVRTAATAIVLAVAILYGFDWLTHRSSQAVISAPPPSPVPVSTPPAAPASSSTLINSATSSPENRPASAVPAAPKPAEPAPAAAATANLHIVCKHNFHAAMLEILVDEHPFYRVALEGKEHNYGLTKRFEGRLDITRPFPVGHHSLRVHVTAPRDHYDDQDVIQGDFHTGEPRTLQIGFGKGSALGMVERNVSLSLY